MSRIICLPLVRACSCYGSYRAVGWMHLRALGLMLQSMSKLKKGRQMMGRGSTALVVGALMICTLAE